MTRPQPVSATVERIDIDADQAPRSGLSPVQLALWSDLVAQGDLPLPTEWNPVEFHRLLRDVAGRRRKWLVKFIAEAIALDIARSSG